MEVLLVANDQTIEVVGAQDALTGAYLNSATVQATILTRGGVEVAGETWPISLTYVPASDGNYQGNFDDAIELIHGKSYVVNIDMDAGGGLKANWHFPVIARYRTP